MTILDSLTCFYYQKVVFKAFRKLNKLIQNEKNLKIGVSYGEEVNFLMYGG